MGNRKHFGYAVEIGPAGVVRENDTSTCGHCQRVTHLRAQTGRVVIRPARCGVCHGALCEECYGALAQGCRVFEKQLEAQEAKKRFLRSISEDTGQ